jgi:hypothetical protein
MDWLKKLLVEKWIGRLLATALAGLSGILVSLGVEEAVVTGWVNATNQLLVAVVPIIISLILDHLQHKIALRTPPPK